MFRIFLNARGMSRSADSCLETAPFVRDAGNLSGVRTPNPGNSTIWSRIEQKPETWRLCFPTG